MSWVEECGRGQEYCSMPLFTGDWSLKARPGTAGTLAPRTTTDYMSPAPHTTATILWTSLSEGCCSLLLWFVLPLASFTGWWADEKKHGITIPANHTGKSDRCARYWACNDDLVPPSWKDQEDSLAQKWWVSGALLRLSLIVVGFLTKPARGLSRLPTLDTERMWRRKARLPRRNHHDLGARCGAKRSTREPQWNWVHFCYFVSMLAWERSVIWFFSQSCP